MKFKNYCAVIMGFTEGVAPEIEKISDSTPNVLVAKGSGMVIATFTSFMSVQEITDWFRENKRSFFVFEINEETAGYYLNKPEIHEGLFGFLDKVNNEELNTKTLDFLKTVAVDVKKIEPIEVDKEITEEDILSFSNDEKEQLLNQFIENGFQNLSEKDKKIMTLLSK